jgi:dipeptidyl aminopeptidase/acylaminoacyl peptidase
MASTIAPYGSWKSPITPETLAAGSVSISQLSVARDRAFWVESRPSEGGRLTILSRPLAGGAIREEIPPRFSARNRVNEYGGGAYCVGPDALWFTDSGDHRVHRVDGSGQAVAITPATAVEGEHRFADLKLSPDERFIVAQRERHDDEARRHGEAINELVIFPADGSAPPRILAEGHDFYAAPCFSPSGRALAWLAWDHPNMPWDGSLLYLADLSGEGEIGELRKVAGGSEISICQPSWSPDGVLHFVSDESGWWNLHALIDGEVVNLCPREAEFGGPQWVSYSSMHAHLSDRRCASIFIAKGQESLGIIETGSIAIEALELPLTQFGQGGELHSDREQRLVFLGGSSTRPTAIHVFDVPKGELRELYRPEGSAFDEAYLSVPRHISFPTGVEETAHAFYYPPCNRDFEAPEGEKPPLMVLCHGGPTGATDTSLHLKAQFFTSRGFAVVDVNYRGSTGYGRAYREAIDGRSGLVEPEDCLAAARHLASLGLVDEARMAIRGGSAGGYVVLCCAVFHRGFKAGTSLYGIADIEALVRDTHKFESRYPQGLIGPYPEAKQTYHDRSPIHFVEQASFPLLILQGLEDPVVPPNQAELMVEGLRKAGLPFAYLAFEGEGHGFRGAATIIRAWEAELEFYRRVLDLGGEAGPGPGLTIENLG